jgi:hypothetical protein
MAEPNKDVDPNDIKIGDDPKPDPPIIPDTELVARLVQEGIDKALKPIKENLDTAYGERDEWKKKVKEKEAEERQAELDRLAKEGKHKERYELQLKEERERREKAEAENILLTRDNTVRNALSTLEFKNDRSSNMAYRDIVEQLVKAENGVWVHRSGVGVAEFIKSYAEDEANSFLFKTKVSTGAGTGVPSKSSDLTPSKKGTKLVDMPIEEVIAMAERGELPTQQR